MMLHQKDQHIWISASAGTGKTKRLSDRYLALLLEEVDPRKILCLTFTKAAAAEMQIRIQNRLSLWSSCTDDVLIEELSSMGPPERVKIWKEKARFLFFKVMDRFEELRIQTIHSFAQSLLSSFPLEAGAPAFFDLLDDMRRGALLSLSRDRVLASTDESILDAWSILLKRFSPDALFALIDKILEDRLAFRTRFESEEALNQALRGFLQLPLKGDADSWIKEACLERHARKDFLESALSALYQTASKSDGEKADTINYLIKNFSLSPVNWWQRYTTIFLTNTGSIRGTLATKKVKENTPQVYEWLEAEAERVYILNQQIKGYHLYILSSSIGLVIDRVAERYNHEKKNQGVLDYDDLIYKAFSLLTSEEHRAWIQYRMDHRIEHVLVDEAQDTNAFQWKMIQALCEEFFTQQKGDARERSLFVVGDEKQSIYSFQGASADLFTYMKSYFKQQVESKELWREHALTLSYRSSSSILRVVDHVFNHADLLGNDSESPRMQHDSFHKTQYGQVSLWPLLSRSDDSSELDAEFSLKSDLAGHIAKSVQDWLATERLLKSQGRSIQPGDVLILVQKRDDFFFDLIRALKRLGVPVAGADRVVLNEQLVFKDLVAFGRFLLNPEDDYSLAVVLKGPLFGLTEEQIALLAFSRGEHSLFDAIMKHTQSENFSFVKDMLKIFLNKLDHETPYGLYSSLLYEHHGLQKILARLGEEACEYVQEFLILAYNFEQNPLVSFELFIDWVTTESFKIKRDFSAQNIDEVRVMTVHGSKGLEAPVVIIADAARLDHDPSRHFWHTTPQGDLLILKESQESQPDFLKSHLAPSNTGNDEEYFRKLYVAMTRAEEELYITGWKPAKQSTEKTWYGYLLESMKEISNQQDNFEALKMGCDPLQNPTYHLIQGSASLISHPKPEEVKQTFLKLPDWVINGVAREDKEIDDLDEKEALLSTELFDFYKTERGVFIHKLLEELPRLPLAMHERFVDHYMKTHLVGSLLKDESGSILRQVQNLLSDSRYAEFFGPDSYAEVPVQDLEQKKSYRIDRLIVKDESVSILDFKSGGQGSEVDSKTLEIYRTQLQNYKRLMKKVYPLREIHAYILWVDSLSLIEV